MELKEVTYKTTEIGLIPDEWEIIRLGDILTFKNGLNKESEYFGYGTPIVNYMDVYANYGLSKDNIQGKVFVSSEEIKNFSAKKGDVFFTRTSETVDEIGISAVLLEDVQKCVFSGFVLRGRDKLNTLTLEFKKYCFSSHLVRKQIISRSTYTTRALTNGRHLSAVYIPIPKDEKEQKAIATALSDVDTLITNLDKLIAKKKAIKQGAMQRLLKSPAQGGQRLPGFEGEWVEGYLGDFCTVITKGTTPTSLGKEFTETGIAFVKAESIAESGTLIQEKLAYIDEETNDLLERSKLKEGDLLFSIAGVLGRIGLIRSIDLPANTNQAVAIVRLNPNKNIERNFVFQILRTTAIKKHIEAISVQGAQSNFSLKDVNEIPITIPFDKDEQTAIASILSDMRDEIESLERKKSKYLRVKQGMMQELLTGKTRLNH
ncbi:restriction endonuclease subunit S [Marivirga lumbricoides]|uniref:Restriction endonuclease subunit S n=1 Tax=Marivirga lumbricoides TaxID=1046115 RepID=A0ABQ1MJA7_9BACT|nr:restriction endonuclease subunit S [Marivirga lumbricoides]